MRYLRVYRLAHLAILLPLAVCLQGCQAPPTTEVLRVSLMNTERYQLPTVGGDEEGARISTQAQHYSISEIRRDAATNWVATYVYQPSVGFVGADYVELEVVVSSGAAPAPSSTKRVAVRFDVHE